MAGDWIKMETELPDKPEVVRMAAILGMGRFDVVGRLHKVWSWWNKHTRDGHAHSVTETFLDELIQRDGFASAMREVDWLREEDGSLLIPNFDRHNGKSAKMRSQALERQKVSRSKRDKCNAPTVTKSVTKALPEKRREEYSNTPLPPKGDSCANRVLPERWRNIPRQDRKTQKVLRNNKTMERIGTWFNRKPDTLWTLAEGIALMQVDPTPDDVDALEGYYLAALDRSDDFRRRDLLTLLNNWSGELDRARIWRAENA